jgi:signal transduction histidine kinase
MQSSYFILIYFFYGLAFFSMGLIIIQEVSRCSDKRLRTALWFLAGFGLLHGSHEWFEMFQAMRVIGSTSGLVRPAFQLGLLSFSFLTLASFGSMLLSQDDMNLRLTLLIPLTLAAIWSFGVLIMLSTYPLLQPLWDMLDVWTRYVLAIPGALLACAGLIVQQREFRRVEMAQFGRDTLWAAVAFAWYGLIGQLFTRPSALWPSSFLNNDLFMNIFGFPVQLLRAGAAIAAAIFVIRFLRSFEVETQTKIAELQEARLEEAKRRELIFGELLHRVVQAQESERQRVARELHDETGQSLTAIGLGLRGIATILRQDSDKAAQNLRQLEGMVAGSLNELQRLITDLRPSHLDDLGLPAALRWYCGNVQNRVPLTVNVITEGEIKDLPAEIKIALFRVAQEALTNVVKHAGAKTASVRLQYLPACVQLEVEDNGCGFDTRSWNQSQRPSWGLLGMEERATLLGGNLSIESSPGQGTRVRVIIPLQIIEEVSHGDSTAVSR